MFNATEEPFLVAQRTYSQRFFKEPSLSYLFQNLKNLLSPQRTDVKGSLWNHLLKKVIPRHREEPLFLRVCVNDCERVLLLHNIYLTGAFFLFNVHLENMWNVGHTLAWEPMLSIQTPNLLFINS